MSILPKGNPQRLSTQDCSKNSTQSDRPALESIVDYRCGKSVCAGAFILRNLSRPIIVFGWEVERIDPTDLSDSLALDR